VSECDSIYGYRQGKLQAGCHFSDPTSVQNAVACHACGTCLITARDAMQRSLLEQLPPQQLGVAVARGMPCKARRSCSKRPSAADTHSNAHVWKACRSRTSPDYQPGYLQQRVVGVSKGLPLPTELGPPRTDPITSNTHCTPQHGPAGISTDFTSCCDTNTGHVLVSVTNPWGTMAAMMAVWRAKFIPRYAISGRSL